MVYAGTSGHSATADVLFGKVAPSGKLPITFPVAEDDLPHPTPNLPPSALQEKWKDPDAMSLKLLTGLPAFSAHYDEGLNVDYKWYDAKSKPVLYPLGFGLTYTTFTYTDLHAQGDSDVEVSFSLTNTGRRSGEEIARVYADLPAATGKPPHRLVGWSKLSLPAGETRL